MSTDLLATMSNPLTRLTSGYQTVTGGSVESCRITLDSKEIRLLLHVDSGCSVARTPPDREGQALYQALATDLRISPLVLWMIQVFSLKSEGIAMCFSFMTRGWTTQVTVTVPKSSSLLKGRGLFAAKGSTVAG